MADEIARGIIRLDGDSSGYKSAMADAVKTAQQSQQQIGASAAKTGEAVKASGEEAVRGSAQMDIATRRFMASLERQAQAAGRTRSEYMELRAAQRGVSEQAAPFIQRIREAERNMGSLEMSAKQTTAAMRLLPAQITDIVTGLVSGQPAYLVAIQQGGQIKDSFGGIVPAARALASVFTPLKIAIGSGVVAGIALVKAYRDGAAEADAFNRALITTGNIAGMTAGQLSVMAKEVSQISGSQGMAAEVMAAFVQTGNVDSSNLVRFTSVAIETQRRLGTAVSDTVKAYADLGKEPVKASERLNSEYRYLTLAVYEQIRALEEQGRRAEAADAAQRAYANAQQDRNRQLEAGLGDYERAWDRLGDAAKKAWDWMLNIGREPDLRSSLASAEARLQAMSPGGEMFGRYGQSEIDAQRKQVELLRQRADTTEGLAAAQGRFNRIQQAGIDAQKYLDQFESKQDRRRAELAKFNAEVAAFNEARRLGGGEALSQSEVERMRQELLKRFSDKGGRPYTDDAATRMLQNLRQTEATLKEQLDTEDKIGAAARERIRFEQQIADLKNKSTLTADQKSLVANESKIRAQLQANEALETEVAIRKIISDQQKKELEAEERFAERAAQINQEIQSARESRLEQYDRQIGAFGLGDLDRQRVGDQSSIFREFQRRQAALSRATPEHMLGSAAYIQESIRIKQALDQALSDHENYYARLRQEQANWENGYTRAVQTYIEQVSNTSGQVESLFSNTFKGLEDLTTDFFTKGKADWRSFGDAIVSEVTRIIVRAQMIQPIAQSLSAGGTGGWFGSLLGGLFGGGSSAPVAASASNPFGMSWHASGDVFGPSGIVNRPTMFAHGGGLGVAGEAGYEAAVPLTRTATGELGVKVSGGAQASPTVVHMTVVTQDAESFRRSEGQIKSRLAGVTTEARRFM